MLSKRRFLGTGRRSLSLDAFHVIFMFGGAVLDAAARFEVFGDAETTSFSASASCAGPWSGAVVGGSSTLRFCIVKFEIVERS